ncbi:MAG: sigma 54-interacting transcriptional regulator [Spirochaetaceae bacterium]|nr:sigma 54-interacting transcriptional regulator [Spirochaetaceae bacterium]
MSILFVAPYPGLVKTAEEALLNSPLPVKVVLGDLQSGVNQALKETAEGNTQIVISRGGTASMLRQNLSVPVFEIEVSGYDLLRAITPHTQRNRKIAVIGYENVISGAKSIAEILNIDLGYFLVTGKKHIETVIREAREWGADVVVGDTISTRTAKNIELLSELVRSGQEAVLSTIEASYNFLTHMNDEILRNKRFNLMMENADSGILYITADGYIEMANSVAGRILQRNREMLIGSKLTYETCPASLVTAVKDQAINQLININDRNYMIEVTQIYTDGIHAATLVFLQSSSRIKNLEVMMRQQMISRGLVASYKFENLIAKNNIFKKTIEKARRYSKTNSTILLLGETGSGKEVFAQSIHNASARKDGPFVALNCAALPDSLLESELFGYAEGAFTGAKKGGKTGLFELAHKGTIFLDEVNEMSNVVQARFLRVLQEKQVMRVGDDRFYDVDVRVIAACNRDLYAETVSGKFRKDLYYRLKVLDIKIPSLNERKDDILPMFRAFIDYFNNKYNYSNISIPEKLEKAIINYNWPGNVRQLRNFAEKVSVLFSLTQVIEEVTKDLLNDLSTENSKIAIASVEENETTTFLTLKEAEANMVYRCWKKNDENISKTARELNVDRATVRKYICMQ